MISAGRSGSRWISRMSAFTGARPSMTTSRIVVAALIPMSVFCSANVSITTASASRPWP